MQQHEPKPITASAWDARWHARSPIYQPLLEAAQRGDREHEISYEDNRHFRPAPSSSMRRDR
ncbi:MAG: hypothetical protein K8H75_00790 [Sulfuricella sp.]|nr:hypothetical protein [Sulfuricella sp.]